MDIFKIVLIRLFDIIAWLIIAKSMMSWFPGSQDSRIYSILDDLTEPIEGPTRKFLSRFNTGPLDMSPMFSILFLWFLTRLIDAYL
nr:YggT family protein [uncultured Peptostreptococcus sp.]